jgi:RNA polymerase sigma factor (sigma-70 family)
VEPTQREQQFRQLFLSQYRHVLAYALRRTRDLADAQDAVAETFTVAWRRIEDAPPDEDARPWLYAIARRTIANQHRSRRRRLALRERLLGGRPRGSDHADAMEGRQRLRDVLTSLSRLS